MYRPDDISPAAAAAAAAAALPPSARSRRRGAGLSRRRGARPLELAWQAAAAAAAGREGRRRGEWEGVGRRAFMGPRASAPGGVVVGAPRRGN